MNRERDAFDQIFVISNGMLTALLPTVGYM